MVGPAAPMPDDPNDIPAPGGEDDAAQPTVLLTVMDNGDGSYTLFKGDEPEPGEGAAPTTGGAGESEDGGVMPMGGSDAEPAGQTFDSASSLLKGIFDILNGGGDDGDSDMEAGYSENAPPTPKSALEKKF